MLSAVLFKRYTQYTLVLLDNAEITLNSKPYHKEKNRPNKKKYPNKIEDFKFIMVPTNNYFIGKKQPILIDQFESNSMLL